METTTLAPLAHWLDRMPYSYYDNDDFLEPLCRHCRRRPW